MRNEETYSPNGLTQLDACVSSLSGLILPNCVLMACIIRPYLRCPTVDSHGAAFLPTSKYDDDLGEIACFAVSTDGMWSYTPVDFSDMEFSFVTQYSLTRWASHVCGKQRGPAPSGTSAFKEVLIHNSHNRRLIPSAATTSVVWLFVIHHCDCAVKCSPRTGGSVGKNPLMLFRFPVIAFKSRLHLLSRRVV
eukprot:5773302-Pyramimonas_sp.AAC.1